MPRKPPYYEPTAEDLARAGQWPIRRDVEYDEDGPAIMCGGQVPHIYAGNAWPSECRSSFGGMTLDQVREDVARHLHYTEHVS